jgi:subtilisin family serine protease
MTERGRTRPGRADDRFIVVVSGDSIPPEVGEAITAAGGALETMLDGMGIAIVHSLDPAFAERLAQHPMVAGVAPNVSSQPDFPPTVLDPGPDAIRNPGGPSGEPLSGYQWNLRSINVEGAWARGLTGRGVLAAVIDSGSDPDNPDLNPNLDFARSVSLVESEPSPIDVWGHGSHIAGIIAAAKNSYGVAGIAPQAKILSAKVVSKENDAAVVWVLQAMKYAVDQGARVLNLSVAFFTDDPALVLAFERAVDYAERHGTVVVAAVGNESFNLDALPPGFHIVPAEVEEVVAVSAVGPLNQQNFDSFATYSNAGSIVDVAAPGGNISPNGILDKRDLVLSSFTTHGISFFDGPTNFHAALHTYWLGTSFATPHVVGAFALILEAHPEFTPAQARAALLNSADDLGPPGRDIFFGMGRINVGRAVQSYGR